MDRKAVLPWKGSLLSIPPTLLSIPFWIRLILTPSGKSNIEIVKGSVSYGIPSSLNCKIHNIFSHDKISFSLLTTVQWLPSLFLSEWTSLCGWIGQILVCLLHVCKNFLSYFLFDMSISYFSCLFDSIENQCFHVCSTEGPFVLLENFHCMKCSWTSRSLLKSLRFNSSWILIWYSQNTPPTDEYTLWRVSFVSINNIGPQNSSLNTVIYTSNGTILSILSKYIPRISQKTRVVKVFVFVGLSLYSTWTNDSSLICYWALSFLISIDAVHCIRFTSSTERSYCISFTATSDVVILRPSWPSWKSKRE